MATPLRHLGDLAKARVTRRSATREDGQALGELEAKPLELPAELEWLGVSGYRISFEGQTIFIDPYLSRVPFGDLLRRRPTLPDPAALDRFVRPPGEVAGVLVGHTHFDHAVDAPAIARRFECRAYGSDSLVTLMGLHGLAERAVSASPSPTTAISPASTSTRSPPAPTAAARSGASQSRLRARQLLPPARPRDGVRLQRPAVLAAR